MSPFETVTSGHDHRWLPRVTLNAIIKRYPQYHVALAGNSIGGACEIVLDVDGGQGHTGIR